MKPKRGYSFENFYLYDGNRVAYLAAQKVIQFPGELFNPFYVYSGTGLGKTHLLWAIHSELGRKGTTLFFTGTEFEKWGESRPDLNVMLIIDDFHTVPERSHETLLAIIDAALANNRQLCFSGTYPPRDLKNLSAKLVSRLEGGLTCDIQPPKEMFLVDMIKKKSEESGIILPDEIALELAQLSSGSIRTIEGMINRLVAYSSLGQFSLDLGTIRLILKEFYPRGVFSPVTSLIEELKKNATDVLQDVTEQANPREEFKEKIYIWEMKGFDITSLKPYLESDIDTLAREYGVFIKKVETLIELQKEFGALDTSRSPADALKIETMLFSPDRIDEIRALINTIRMRSAAPSRTFADFIIGQPNRTACDLYRNRILANLGKQFNPMVIIGDRGVGKTHLLSAIYADLTEQGKAPLFYDLRTATSNFLSPSFSDEVVLIDNFNAITAEAAPHRERLFALLRDCLKQDRQVIIATETLPTDIALTKSEREMFELGIEVHLDPPDEDLARAYIAARTSNAPPPSLPAFSSFYEIDDFIAHPPTVPEYAAESKPPPAAEPVPAPVAETEVPAEPAVPAVVPPAASVPPASAPGDVVPLGLPGEEGKAAEPAAAPPIPVVKPAAPAPESSPEPSAEKIQLPLPAKPFEPLKEHRVLLPDFINELIEENF